MDVDVRRVGGGRATSCMDLSVKILLQRQLDIANDCDPFRGEVPYVRRTSGTLTWMCLPLRAIIEIPTVFGATINVLSVDHSGKGFPLAPHHPPKMWWTDLALKCELDFGRDGAPTALRFFGLQSRN